MAEAVDDLQGLAKASRAISMDVYRQAAEYARVARSDPGRHQIRVGHRSQRTGERVLIDEVLTPDSSRYWPADQYKPGGPQPSFDKQFVRDWLETTGWDKASPPPPLPDDVVARTREKYVEAYEILTGQPFPWK